MNNQKTFTLETSIGPVSAQVIGSNEIYVETVAEDGKGHRPVTIRGIAHTGSLRFGWNLIEWDGRTYDNDGNTLCFVSSKRSGGSEEYFKTRAVWLSKYCEWVRSNDATPAAKVKFYDTIKKSLNDFCRISVNWRSIQAEMAERRLELYNGKIESLQQKISDLNGQLAEATEELNSLQNNPPQ